MRYALLFLFMGSVSLGATFQNPELKFSFEYDESQWSVVPENPGAKKQGADVDRTMAQKTLVTVQRNRLDDKYHARFSVVSDPLEKGQGGDPERLTEYRKKAVQFLNDQRFHVLSTEDVLLPNLKTAGLEIIAHQRDFGLTFRQVIFVRNRTAYILTAATRTKLFDVDRPELSKFVETFRFAP